MVDEKAFTRKNLKHIVITLENCEEVILPSEAFGALVIDNIHSRICRIGHGTVLHLNKAGEVAVEVLPDANKLGTINPAPNPHCSVIERLTSHFDIVSIEMCFEYGQSCEIYAEYDTGDNDAVGADNLNQKHYISKNGALYIVISSSGKKINDFFDFETINSKGYKAKWPPMS